MRERIVDLEGIVWLWVDRRRMLLGEKDIIVARAWDKDGAPISVNGFSAFGDDAMFVMRPVLPEDNIPDNEHVSVVLEATGTIHLVVPA